MKNKVYFVLLTILLSNRVYAQKEKVMKKKFSLHTNDSIQIENLWIKLTSNYRASLIKGGHFLQAELFVKSKKEDKQIVFRISQETTKTIDSFDNYFIEWIEPDWNASKQTFIIKKINK